MAYNSMGFYLNVTLVDKASKETHMRIEMNDTAYADVVTDVNTLIPLLLAVTDATLRQYTITQVFDNDAYALPAAYCTVTDRAVITVKLAGGGNKAGTISIPAPSAGIFAGSSGENLNIVDVEDSDLVAFVELFATEAELSDGEHIVEPASGGIVKGRRSNRKFGS